MIITCYNCGEKTSNHGKNCSKCGASLHTNKIVQKAGKVIKRTTYVQKEKR